MERTCQASFSYADWQINPESRCGKLAESKCSQQSRRRVGRGRWLIAWWHFCGMDMSVPRPCCDLTLPSRGEDGSPPAHLSIKPPSLKPGKEQAPPRTIADSWVCSASSVNE